MIREDLYNMLISIDSNDVFDTFNQYWRDHHRLGAEKMPRYDFGDEETNQSTRVKYLNSAVCPECGHPLSFNNICSKEPLAQRGYKTTVICENEECTYYEYSKKSFTEMAEEAMKEE